MKVKTACVFAAASVQVSEAAKEVGKELVVGKKGSSFVEKVFDGFQVVVTTVRESESIISKIVLAVMLTLFVWRVWQTVRAVFASPQSVQHEEESANEEESTNEEESRKTEERKKVFVTETGSCFHWYKECHSLKKAYKTYELTECLHCKKALKENQE